MVNNMFLAVQNMRWNMTEFESYPDDYDNYDGDSDSDGLNDYLNYYAIKKIHMY